MKNKVVFITGPTASGKSNIALKLAKIFNGVIISADSMQVYKTLDIGTAKESLSNRQAIKHYMIDIVNYDENFSVAEYKDMALKCIEKAISEGKTPFVVGGTGLYIESLVRPMSFSNADKNENIRKQLEDDLQKFGEIELYRRLSEIDPESAKKLFPKDTKRVIRALEIYMTTGKTKSSQKDVITAPDFDYIMLGLDMDRALLYHRINERVELMFEQGLESEVLSIGDYSLQSMQAIGYKEFKDYNGLNSFDIKEKIKKNSRNYAKRQLTWLRRYKEMNWINAFDELTAINLVDNFLKI